MPFTLRANTDQFEQIRDGRHYSAFASELAVHQSTLTRVLRQGVAPGPKFVAQALHVLPYRFDQLFHVVDESDVPSRN